MEFYGGQLLTDHSIISRQTAESLQTFWPRGSAKPFVFVDVVGREEQFYSGQKGNISLDSKFNSDEAAKIVSIACLYAMRMLLYICMHITLLEE